MLGSKKQDSTAVSADLPEAARLKLAIGAGGFATYEWNLETDALTWSCDPECAFGDGKAETWRTGAAFRAALSTETAGHRDAALKNAAKSDRFSVTYPFERDGGHVVWLEERGQGLRNGDGRFTRVVGVIRNVTGAKRVEARLQFLASFDELTGLHNRACLRDAITNAISDCEGCTGPVGGAYMIAGIDNLSLINQAYGYETADQVIVAVGQRIAAVIQDGDVLGRSAGNKFGLVLPNRTPAEIADFARRMRENVRATIIETPRGAVCATVSAGAVTLPEGAKTSEEAMARAEEALDLAKRQGRDSFRAYEISAHRDSLRRRLVSIADQVVAALNERRLVFAYQPVVAADSKEVLSSECLLRMIQPDGQVISAGEFVPVTERIGLISHIDQRALELAIDTLKRYPAQHLSLNVSGMTASDSGWLEGFLAHLRVNQGVADRLTIELTETAALQDLKISAQFMENLRELGCKVAIDDFGAGYTSFRNLQVFDIDSVKIDGSFIQGLATSPDNQLFVRTLVNLAKNFGVMVVAECVGNEEEAAILRRMGVDAFQGFHFGYPEIAPAWLDASLNSALLRTA